MPRCPPAVGALAGGRAARIGRVLDQLAGRERLVRGAAGDGNRDFSWGPPWRRTVGVAALGGGRPPSWGGGSRAGGSRAGGSRAGGARAAREGHVTRGVVRASCLRQLADGRRGGGSRGGGRSPSWGGARGVGAAPQGPGQAPRGDADGQVGVDGHRPPPEYISAPPPHAPPPPPVYIYLHRLPSGGLSRPKPAHRPLASALRSSTWPYFPPIPW